MNEQEFLEYVQSGGQVETDDPMPDEYRAKLIKFIEMHGNSELMGVLPEREWILRAPTLQRKLALRSEEHTSELQSRQYLVCRLLLEKKKITIHMIISHHTAITCTP